MFVELIGIKSKKLFPLYDGQSSIKRIQISDLDIFIVNVVAITLERDALIFPDVISLFISCLSSSAKYREGNRHWII